MNKIRVIVAGYLFAIVVANLMVTTFGQSVLYITAFLIIPFDLLARDILHEKWKKNNLFLRLFVLIVTGSVLSYVLNTESWIIGIASCFGCLFAGIANTIVYHLVYATKHFFRMNFSNAFAVIVDSVVFIVIAFGFDLQIVVIQIFVKFFGGMLWSYGYIRLLRKEYDLK